MRDPDGHVEFVGNEVLRTIKPGVSSIAFLKTEAARSMVNEGALLEYQFISDDKLVSPRIGFVSYPSEWCDSQLYDAARFTLTLARRALEQGYELKDASAYNIIFEGVFPRFCDHLSFVPITSKQWWAMGQFARHFILPLLLAKKLSWHALRFHQLSADGIDPAQASRLLGLKKFITLAWPMMLDRSSRDTSGDQLQLSIDVESPYHQSLIAYCGWCLKNPCEKQSSDWSGYVKTRSHYALEASFLKREVVVEWISHVSPNWVIDLGCNTGEFSYLAANAGPSVVAIDSDHACIAEIYRSAVQRGLKKIYPVIADITDLHSGGGWLGTERPDLISRLKSCGELVMCLGLMHHFIAGNSIPLSHVAQFLAELTEKFLILEVISPTDPMVVSLMSSRRRSDIYPSSDDQICEIGKYFEILKSQKVNETRELLLCAKRNIYCSHE